MQPVLISRYKCKTHIFDDQINICHCMYLYQICRHNKKCYTMIEAIKNILIFIKPPSQIIVVLLNIIYPALKVGMYVRCFEAFDTGVLYVSQKNFETCYYCSLLSVLIFMIKTSGALIKIFKRHILSVQFLSHPCLSSLGQIMETRIGQKHAKIWANYAQNIHNVCNLCAWLGNAFRPQQWLDPYTHNHNEMSRYDWHRRLMLLLLLYMILGKIIYWPFPV